MRTKYIEAKDKILSIANIASFGYETTSPKDRDEEYDLLLYATTSDGEDHELIRAGKSELCEYSPRKVISEFVRDLMDHDYDLMDYDAIEEIVCN